MLTLSDQKLFSLFVKLKRAVRNSNFDTVQTAALTIEEHLISMEKRHLMAFTYLYVKLSGLTPKRTKFDEQMSNGTIRKSQVFLTSVTDEQRLTGLRASVKYNQLGGGFLRVVYADPNLIERR